MARVIAIEGAILVQEVAFCDKAAVNVAVAEID